MLRGAQLRCWSDRESGTIALCFDASSAPAGLLASLTWKLQSLDWFRARDCIMSEMRPRAEECLASAQLPKL